MGRKWFDSERSKPKESRPPYPPQTKSIVRDNTLEGEVSDSNITFVEMPASPYLDYFRMLEECGSSIHPSIVASVKERAAKAAQDRALLESKENALRSKISNYLLKTQHTLEWDSVVGNETAKQAFKETLEYPITQAELYAFYGKVPSKGVLLYGPPGCGKTMLAKTVASQLAVLHKQPGATTMIVVNGPSIQSPYVGVTEQIIRNIFAYASVFKQLYGYPLVVFVDEADALLPSRSGAGGRQAHSWEESNIATFLAEMDGIETSGAFVILASNRPEVIDEALLRDGRCDRKIRVERPDREAARILLKQALVAAPLQQIITAPQLDSEILREHALRVLIAQTIELFYADWQVLAELRGERSSDYLRLRDIVSGAMLVGLAERLKSTAFARDLAAGSATGISVTDIEPAVRSVLQDNTGLTHASAITEYCERVGISTVRVVALPAPVLALD